MLLGPLNQDTLRSKNVKKKPYDRCRREHEPKDTKRERNGAKGIPKGAEWEPNGSRMGAEWEPKSVKRRPKGGKGTQRAPFAEQERKSEETRADKHAD